MLWKSYVSVSCISVDERLVDLFVDYKNFSFYLSCVYGHPVPKYRGHLWEKLQRLAVSRVGSWMICGDMNELSDPAEKIGGQVRSETSVKAFKTMLQICDMKDLKSKGNPFSWVGRRRTEIIECCLDRVFVNSAWLHNYPFSENEFFEIAESDHRPMIVTVGYRPDERRGLLGMISVCIKMRALLLL